MKSEFDLILPYVTDLKPYLLDPEVSEIMVNADGSVFIEVGGSIATCDGIHIPEGQRQAAVSNIARLLGDNIDRDSPLLDSRLPDGSRVAAVMPPASVGGTVIAIRKFRARHFSADELVRVGMLTANQLELLRHAVESHLTILISGGTGSGKTTLLNALSGFLSPHERVVLIEDTAELSIDMRNLVRLEAQRAQPGRDEITIRHLLRSTLRLRPDRIIVGEVRGAEAFDLLQALNTGHSGSLSTIHANNARMALSRLRTCIAMAGEELPDRAITQNIADAIQVLVHVVRTANGLRRVSEILTLGRYDASQGVFETKELQWEAETVSA